MHKNERTCICAGNFEAKARLYIPVSMPIAQNRKTLLTRIRLHSMAGVITNLSLLLCCRDYFCYLRKSIHGSNLVVFPNIFGEDWDRADCVLKFSSLPKTIQQLIPFLSEIVLVRQSLVI